MAKTMYAIEYLGAFSMKANQKYSSANIKTQFPEATVLKMKTHEVKIAIDNTDMFPITYDDETYLVTGHTYIPNIDCIVVVGKYVLIA